MSDNCSICFREKTMFDDVNETFTDIEDKTYCEDCFEDLGDSIICCDRCYDGWKHKKEDFDERFIEMKNINNDVIYCHIKCLYENEKCPICKNYLKNEECVTLLTGYYDYEKTEYHIRCVEDKNNNFKDKMCYECDISLREKCNRCEYRFIDCYNKNCKNYAYFDEDGRYDGCCGKCNW